MDEKNPCSKNYFYFYKTYDVIMDLMFVLHFFSIQAKNPFSRLFAIYFAPNIDLMQYQTSSCRVAWMLRALYNLIIAICITYNIHGAYIQIMDWDACIICRTIITVQMSCPQMKKK